MAWHDVTNAELDTGGITDARKTEMKFVKEVNAYTRCPRTCVEKEDGKLVDVKWFLSSTEEARPIRTAGRAYCGGNSTSTGMMHCIRQPPVEAMRVILGDAATTDDGNNE